MYILYEYLCLFTTIQNNNAGLPLLLAQFFTS